MLQGVMSSQASTETPSVEEALGSVTQIDVSSPSSGVLLRSSARVSKMKLDSLNKSIITSPVAEKYTTEEDVSEEVDKPTEKVPMKKTFWPQEDKDLFFEALNEYGKDFHKIQSYFAAKSKKADNTEVKTEQQIRCFYYRTYAKIAPKLKFSEHVTKKAQELYGLINYGELRKKMKVRSKRDALRLNELVIKGFTQLKGKNKKFIHVRTPRCRALRRLCQVEDSQETETRLPGSVRLELIPADNRTWARVQALAQNPRVHIHVPLQYRLQNLLQYLQKRWLPAHDKYKAKIVEGFEGESALPSETGEQLVLKPKHSAAIHPCQVNLSHCNSHIKICLSSYEERLGKKGASLEILNKLKAEFGLRARKLRLLGKEQTEAAKTVEETDAKKSEEGQKEVKLVEDEGGDQKGEVRLENVPMDVEEMKIDDMKDEGPVTEVVVPDSTIFEEDGEEKTKEPSTEEGKQTDEEVAAKLRNGWSVENCKSLTVGDIYLMLGSDYKLKLNYYWKPTDETIAGVASVAQLTSMLQRLVRLSKLIRPHCPVQCPCGHECAESRRMRKDSFGEDGGILATSDTAFRRPLVQVKRVIQSTGRLDADSFRAQMDKLTPRYCNRRGRGISPKSVVVQRTLPKALLPKPTNEHPIVSLKGLPELITVETAPTNTGPRPIAPKKPEPPDPPPSPTPSINTLLSDTFKHFPPPANFAGGDIDEPPPSPSPSVVLRESWLNEEVTDYSLSSILSHLDAPLKATATDTFETSAPPDVETQLQYLLTESSIDYMAKFADLAAKVTSEGSQ